MYIDAHCHLDYPSLQDDFTATLKKAAEAGITGFLNTGVSPETWVRQRALARQFPGIAWTGGLHPVFACRLTEDAYRDAFAQLLLCFEGDHQACGVGEIGLDRVFAPKSTMARQLDIFEDQLNLARRLNKPCVLHIVGAHGAALELMRRVGLPQAGGMVHSFSGSRETAREYLRLGLHISITARQVARMGRKIRSVVEEVPWDRLMVESDAPDQCPKGSAINTPTVIVDAAVEIAALRGVAPETVLMESTRNCASLFEHNEWASRFE